MLKFRPLALGVLTLSVCTFVCVMLVQIQDARTEHESRPLHCPDREFESRLTEASRDFVEAVPIPSTYQADASTRLSSTRSLDETAQDAPADDANTPLRAVPPRY